MALCFVLGLFILVAGPCAYAQSGSISGTVSLANSKGDGLAGATVTDGTRQATTASDGQYTIANMPPGTFNLAASKTGYVIAANSGTNPTEITSNQASGRNFTAYPVLTSPIYTFWNGFLSMINVLELINTSTASMSVTLTLYDQTGAAAASQVVTIAAGAQSDIILNTLEGFTAASYGLVKIEFNGTGLDGRVSFYRYAANVQNFEFAFSLPLANAVSGNSYVAFNTFQPSLDPADSSNLVAQWLSVANLHPSASKDFVVKRYDQAGTLLTTQNLSVPPLGVLDIEGGHQNPGPNHVGLSEVVPADPSSPYLARLSRYGGDAPAGVTPETYSFTLMHLARNGLSRTQYLAISNTGGAGNWVEVANGSDDSASVNATFYDSLGVMVRSQFINLAPYAQQHLDAGSILPDNSSGFVRLDPVASDDEIIAHTAFYFRDEQSGALESVYTTTAQESFGSTFTGSYNLFLGMANWLRLINLTAQTQTLDVSLVSGGNTLYSTSVQLAAYSRAELGLHDTATYNTTLNTYGTITVAGASAGGVLAELLRYRSDSSAGLDFAFTTRFRSVAPNVQDEAGEETVPCEDGSPFSVEPLSTSAYTSITPLGNVNPGGHTFPTLHTYMMLTDTAVAQPIYAPGDFTITSVASDFDLSTNKGDYAIRFSICSDVTGYFNHVTTVTDDILAQVGELDDCFDSGGIRHCEGSVEIDVSAGTLIGYAGGPTNSGSAALDLGLRDQRTDPITYANPDRAGTADAFYVVCPWDYFESGAVRDRVMAKLQAARTIAPICGTIQYDIANTAQGKWFLEGSPINLSEGEHIALFSSNFDPGVGLISVGNTDIGRNAYHFDPQSSGLLRRDFSAVRSDGNTYCFDNLRTRYDVLNGNPIAGYIFLRMTSDTELTLERVTTGSCPADPNTLSFTSAARDFER